MPAVSRVMATVFWYHTGVLLVDFLERGATMNAAVYGIRLERLRAAIRRGCPGLLTGLLLQANAFPGTAALTRELLQDFWWENFNHFL